MKKKIIHTITIRFYTDSHICTDTIWNKLMKMIKSDRDFTDKFSRILITGKNNLE